MYIVNPNGAILAERVTDINDGSYWCFNYKKEYDGRLAYPHEGFKEFNDFSKAVRYSKDQRLLAAKKEYEEKIAAIEAE